MLLLRRSLLVPIDTHLPSLDATAAVAAEGCCIDSDHLHELGSFDAVAAEEDREVIAGDFPLGSVYLEGLVLLLIQQKLEAALVPDYLMVRNTNLFFKTSAQGSRVEDHSHLGDAPR